MGAEGEKKRSRPPPSAQAPLSLSLARSFFLFDTFPTTSQLFPTRSVHESASMRACVLAVCVGGEVWGWGH